MCFARCGCPRTPSKIADTNLDCVIVKNAPFLHRSLIEKSQQNIVELVTIVSDQTTGTENTDLLLFGSGPADFVDGSSMGMSIG